MELEPLSVVGDKSAGSTSIVGCDIRDARTRDFTYTVLAI